MFTPLKKKLCNNVAVWKNSQKRRNSKEFLKDEDFTKNTLIADNLET